MDRYLARHRVDFFLLERSSVGRAVLARLEERGWTPVFFDGSAIVLLRRDGAHADLARRAALRAIDPAAADPLAFPEEAAPLALLDADRVVEDCPASPFGWLGRARALLLLRRPSEALAASAQALAREPRLAHAEAQTCLAHAMLGEHRQAVEACERALSIDPGEALARGAMDELERQGALGPR